MDDVVSILQAVLSLGDTVLLFDMLVLSTILPAANYQTLFSGRAIG